MSAETVLGAARDDLFAKLESLGIRTATKEHPPIMTVEDGWEHWKDVPGVHCKNLFLKDAKAVYWLLVVPADQPVDLKQLPPKIGSKRLSFASAERLREVLKVHPGSVTPFALINDGETKVQVVLEASMMDKTALNFHPLTNTATTTISPQGLLTFINDCGHRPLIVKLDG